MNAVQSMPLMNYVVVHLAVKILSESNLFRSHNFSIYCDDREVGEKKKLLLKITNFEKITVAWQDLC